MRVTIATGGSRGDVQPYLALGKRLREEGAEVRVATDSAFEGFVAEAGLEFYPVSIDLQQLLNELLEKEATNPITQARELSRHVGPLLQTNAREFADAAADADVLLHTPATFMAYYVAKYLGIPAVSGEMQPAMRSTGEFRSSIVPPVPSFSNPRLTAISNRLSYVFAHEAFWHSFKSPMNEVITKQLRLPPARSLTSYDAGGSVADARDATLCGWSPQVLPKPRAWADNVHVTGYWFLDAPENYQPPEELLDFMGSGPKPVCIGFGSTSNIDPQWASEIISEALHRTATRAVLLTGWSSLDQADFPQDVFVLKQAPHDWLFPRVSAAIHHGGSATIGASLRAGIPTVTIPFWFDQSFWGERVAELGAGPDPIPPRRLTAERLSDAITAATTDYKIRDRAAQVGKAIASEDGCSAAIEALEKHGVLR